MASNVLLGAGFAGLGVLVGILAGLSTAQLTTTLLGLLFGFGGGSIIALVQKLDAEAKKAAGLALLTFSLAATAGILGGLTIRLNDLLRTRPLESTTQGLQSRTDYMKGATAQAVDFLQAQVMRGELPLRDACRVMKP